MSPRPVIFVHVPKSGGTTFVQVLTRHFARAGVLHRNALTLDELAETLAPLSPRARARVRCVHGHIPFGVHRLLGRPATYLTLLREPVDRFVSAYHFMRTHPDTPLHRFLTDTRISLEDFVATEEAALRFHDRQARMLAGEAIPGEPEDLLARARLHAERDFAAVGLRERFDESLLLMGRVLGWLNLVYVPVNVTRDRPPLAEVPARVRDAIAERSQADLALYAWARQRFAAQLELHGVGGRRLSAFRAVNAGYGAARALLRSSKAALSTRRS